MSSIYTGGPAFPTGAGVSLHKSGMTLRDYFAGICLPRAMEMTNWIRTHAAGDPLAAEPERWAAKAAYKMADAMLEARDQ